MGRKEQDLRKRKSEAKKCMSLDTFLKKPRTNDESMVHTDDSSVQSNESLVQTIRNDQSPRSSNSGFNSAHQGKGR